MVSDISIFNTYLGMIGPSDYFSSGLKTPTRYIHHSRPMHRVWDLVFIDLAADEAEVDAAGSVGLRADWSEMALGHSKRDGARER